MREEKSNIGDVVYDTNNLCEIGKKEYRHTHIVAFWGNNVLTTNNV